MRSSMLHLLVLILSMQLILQSSAIELPKQFLRKTSNSKKKKTTLCEKDHGALQSVDELLQSMSDHFKSAQGDHY